MKAIIALVFALLLSCNIPCNAQPDFSATNDIELNEWYFLDTNWLSHAGYAPVGFSNIVNLFGDDGGQLLLDTTNTTPAFLFYNIVETNSDGTTFTNITPGTGTLYVWFSPNWTSTNQGGAGPGDWADLISIGEYSTNGTPWWAWYLSPDGCNIYFASQTNGGTPSVYLSAPVSLLSSNWYNLVLTYSSTNSSFYTNAVLVTNGLGIINLPGPSPTFFAIGSDTNGYHQGRGLFSDLDTYNFEFNSNAVWENFTYLTPMYGLGEYQSAGQPVTNASSSAPWFAGPGDLIPSGAGIDTNICGTTSAKFWLTNEFVSMSNNGTASITFTIAGGPSGAYYDVFGISALTSPVTNDVWAWLGRGQTCHIYTITNLPGTAAFLILGSTNDFDQDGLTDAFELLVSHTSTNSPDTFSNLPDAWVALNGLVGTNGLATNDPDLDGLTNWQEYLYGTKPLVPEGNTIWVGNPAGYSGIP